MIKWIREAVISSITYESVLTISNLHFFQTTFPYPYLFSVNILILILKRNISILKNMYIKKKRCFYL